ncbi:hypothetical protein Pmar_PMAR009850 [Perkinsus marinus ATCC 50983]|uniref:Uncharacterized protein n=1 Tax=Perkinsus marinus (strain ATCC 50983 / TXsc) TaxID=423536 RepID=C5KV89_PERM5|nr:hypothetical protein Pmar_PMAR009850 [Perkinsus marinus ATCC 50983]EER11635.1 hypothetical protein Pmar_PMAR009850 [Perkinsus marinus ATCC 50983]|eukprot:XP_002779840.1 hypothetical protein Pmar_PMAR009850 [Perkinsus marinus ATCC 50983]
MSEISNTIKKLQILNIIKQNFNTKTQRYLSRVYKKMNKTVGTETVASRTIIYVSFGGLLMKLEAQRSDVDEAIRLDDRLYLLMRKVY